MHLYRAKAKHYICEIAKLQSRKNHSKKLISAKKPTKTTKNRCKTSLNTTDYAFALKKSVLSKSLQALIGAHKMNLNNRD